MLAHYAIGQRGDGTGGDAAALLENAELARHTPRERQFLFDEQKKTVTQRRDFSPESRRRFRAGDVSAEWPPWVRQISSCGSSTSARPMASCCCWPPTGRPPRRFSHLFKAEQLEDPAG